MRRSLKLVLAFGLFLACLALCSLSAGPGEARLCVWDGESSSALASNATNWDNDLAPVANDSILFDGLNATADDPCTWDLATDSFGTFTIAAGYSGTITQSSDMYISGYSQAGGTFTAIYSKTVNCNGSFIKSGGTLTNGVLNLVLNGNGIIYEVNAGIPGKVTIYGIVELKGATGTYAFVNNGICNITGSGHGWIVRFFSASGGPTITPNNNYFINNGQIIGTGTLTFWLYLASVNNLIIGDVESNVQIRSTDSRSLSFGESININQLSITTEPGTNTCTLDLNGHSLTASSITVGTRGILQCGEGTITCTNITSTAGTIIPETATWIFTGHGTIKCIAGQQFYNCYMDLPVTITNTINCTHDARIINIPSIYYAGIDIYKNGIYNHTVIPTGTYYSAGPKLLTGGAYTYLPDIIITLGPWLEDLNFTRKASITTNLPVTYNITGTAADWLIINEGMISGIPPAPGTYTYTITATHSSGSMDVESGVLAISSDSLSVIAWNDSIAAGVVLGLLITTISFLGYWKQIPILQLIAVAVLIFSLVIFLRIGHFAPFLLLFILVNMVMFVLGMIRYYQGR